MKKTFCPSEIALKKKKKKKKQFNHKYKTLNMKKKSQD